MNSRGDAQVLPRGSAPQITAVCGYFPHMFGADDEFISYMPVDGCPGKCNVEKCGQRKDKLTVHLLLATVP